MIRLVPIDHTNYRECQNLTLDEIDLGFVGSNSRALAKAYVYYNSTFPSAIYHDEIMVGFTMYRHMEKLGNYLIEKLMIDKRFQGKGYGREAMKILLDKMRKEKKYAKVCICTKVNNVKSLRLYHSLGFKQTEPEEENEIVLGMEI